MWYIMQKLVHIFVWLHFDIRKSQGQMQTVDSDGCYWLLLNIVRLDSGCCICSACAESRRSKQNKYIKFNPPKKRSIIKYHKHMPSNFKILALSRHNLCSSVFAATCMAVFAQRRYLFHRRIIWIHVSCMNRGRRIDLNTRIYPQKCGELLWTNFNSYQLEKNTMSSPPYIMC